MNPTPNPYAAPTALDAPAGPDISRPSGSASRRRLRRSATCLALSLACLAVSLTLLGCFGQERAGILGFLSCGVAAMGCALTGAGLAVAGIAAARHDPGRRLVTVLWGAVLFAVQGGMLLLGALATLFMLSGGRGRQVRSLGRVLLPRLRPRDDWSRTASGAPVIAIDPALRDRVGAAWRENAKTEHASVAAFARLTLDLMALGAPPELLVASQNDGLDEIAHARMCLSLAASIDGKHEGPAPFPEVRHTPSFSGGRVVALSTLAVSSLVDGVLHEGVSARVIARLARLAEDAEIRRVLFQLAADEGRHAAHAWRVVEWCVSEGGEPVVHALQGSVRIIPKERSAAPIDEAADGSWERWGLPGATLDAAEYLAARAQLVRRVAKLRAFASLRARVALGRHDPLSLPLVEAPIRLVSTLERGSSRRA